MNVIMNPPYDGSLHLKILDSVIKTFPEAKIVNLSPNFYENYKHTANIPVASNIEVIEKNIASQMFGGIQLSYNLAIQLYGKTKDYSLLTKFTPKAWTILSKKKYKSSFKDVFIEDYDCVGVFVPLKLMTASWDKNKNDIVDKLGILVDGHTENGSYYKDERKKNKNRPCGGIKFSDKIQAQNFVKYTQSNFFRCWVKTWHINSRYILKEYPYLEDYTHEWTDEMLYKYFDLTEEEIKTIEKEIKTYNISNI